MKQDLVRQKFHFFFKKFTSSVKKRKLTGLLMESPGSEWAIEDFQID